MLTVVIFPMDAQNDGTKLAQLNAAAPAVQLSWSCWAKPGVVKMASETKLRS